MNVISYRLKNGDSGKNISVVVPTKSVNGTLFQNAKMNLSKISEKLDHEITLTAVEDSGTGFSFAKSVNRGIEEINADIYLNMNDDVILNGNSFETAVKYVSEKDLLMGALLYYPNGKIQHAGMSIDLVCSSMDSSFMGFFLDEIKTHKAPFDAFRKIKYMRNLGLDKFLYINHYKKVNPSSNGVVTGAFHMFSSNLLKKLKGYDENYKVGFEDIDFCLNALKNGFNIRMSNGINGIHKESPSTGRVNHPDSIIKYFQEKWANEETLKLIENNGYLYIK